MKVFFALLLFTFSYQAQAVVTVTGVSGVSLNDNNPVTTVWGVFVGVSDTTLAEPYNNCRFELPLDPTDTTGTRTLFEGCHESRVNGNTAISVTFTEDAAVTDSRAVAVIRRTTGNVSNNILLVQPNGPIFNGENQTTTVTFTWADLCNNTVVDGVNASIRTTGSGASSKSQCVVPDGSGGFDSVNAQHDVFFGFAPANTPGETSSTTRVIFYLYSPDPGAGVINPSNPTPNCMRTSPRDADFGFCDLSVFPGDGGGFLTEREDIGRNNTLTGGSSAASGVDSNGISVSLPVTVTGMRLFFSEDSFVQAQPINDFFADIDIVASSGANPSFVDNSFGGLNNGTNYFARAATIDSSGTISQLMDEETYCPGNVCPDFLFQPSEVAGIIAESSCFITTVAYGSAQAHQVQLFRKFRAKYLWTNFLGHIISDFYDAYGPYAAAWIKRNPSSKTFARIMLYPFYGFAYLSLYFGFFIALITYVFGASLAVFGFKKIKKGLK